MKDYFQDSISLKSVESIIEDRFSNRLRRELSNTYFIYLKHKYNKVANFMLTVSVFDNGSKNFIKTHIRNKIRL